MAKKAPGQHHRQGISRIDLAKRFATQEQAEKWFVTQRWPNGIICPKCASRNIQERVSRKPQPYRCRTCLKDFSVKTDTLMHNSKLTCQQWAFAIYEMSVGLKGMSSMKLHRDLNITQKSAWHLGHRIRATYLTDLKLAGPVEVDETYIGGKEKNKHKKHQTKEGRGPVGKVAIIGVKSRTHNHIQAKVIDSVSAATLQRFVASTVKDGAMVYSDQNPGYIGLKYCGYTHESVNHSSKEFVNGQAHTNGIESFWSMLKRGYHGTYHQMSAKHLPRYVNEFAGRHNVRQQDTSDQMTAMVIGMKAKRLPYKELVK